MKIGSVQLKNNVLAAPMAGVTDKAFRILAREAGCGMVYTEMVSAKALTYGNRKTSEILDLSGEPSPLAVQIFGSDPQVVAEGADIAVKAGADIVDINMGCPAPKIVRNGEGAALMLDMDLALEVAGAVVERVDVPVTVKMRKGWDQQSVNSVEMSVGMEGVGVSGITVHGRTRDQFYAGRADWDIIKEVKRAVGIPVIGNGDIWKPQDARDMLEYTQCDGIMVEGGHGKPMALWQILSYIRDGSAAGTNSQGKDFIGRQASEIGSQI